MQEQLLKTIKAKGVTSRIRCMQVSLTPLSDNCFKVNIYCGVENRVIVFEMKKRKLVTADSNDAWEFEIERVRSLEKLSGITTDVCSLWVVYEDAMQTDEPAMYVGGADGNVYLTIPTDKTVYVADFVSGSFLFSSFSLFPLSLHFFVDG